MNSLKDDLEHILAKTKPLWEELRGKQIFITGGTGFFGTWLLESFHHANTTLNLGAQVTVLSRNPESFLAKNAHLRSLRFHQGDVKDFTFPAGKFTHVIHAATAVNEKPEDVRNVIVAGTQRVLDFSAAAGVSKFLFVSSGAVYGAQPAGILKIAETDSAPSDIGNPYGEGKRDAERLCGEYSGKFEVKVARCFALVGPHLPLDAHFAIGNFIRDGLQGGTVQVAGDGTAVRSYLYAADLAIWLWTILFRGVSSKDGLHAYNVGSDQEISIAALAGKIAQKFGSHANVLGKPVAGYAPNRYVPSIKRAQEELGLQVWVPLDEAIARTLDWHQTRT